MRSTLAAICLTYAMMAKPAIVCEMMAARRRREK